MRSFARKFLLATAALALPILVSATAMAQDDPPAQAGRLSSLSGAVSIQPLGSDNWGQATANLPLGPGDRVFTDSDGRAEIQVGRTFLRIGPNSDVSFVGSSPDGISFGIAQGSVHIRAFGLWPGQALHINTPSGSATMNEPGEIRVDVLPDEHAAIFTCLSNDVYLSGAGGFGQPIGNGQALELAGSNPVYPQWLEPAGPDSLDEWSQGRDRQIEHVASYRYVSPEIPGAEELDANGTWLPGTSYGAVWFPNSVPEGWAPYHYGHWINHEPWGWVWVEDESWGYAPFHFGRWVSIAGRWGWVPGPPAAHPVWSPALVVFAGGMHVGGAGVSAWFPLGPGEAYRPWYRTSPRYIDEVNLSNMGESRQVHVQRSYANSFNDENIQYANRSIGFSAMRSEDFASGRPAHRSSVVLDIHLFDHIQVLVAPEPRPMPHYFGFAPPARQVPIRAERPVLMNHEGMLVSARPGAQAVAPPVREAPPARPLPGRNVVAPPPGAPRFAPGGRAPMTPEQPQSRPAPQSNPTQPGRPAGGFGQQPQARPAAPPAATPAPPSYSRPAAVPAPPPTPIRPAPQPAPAPAPRQVPPPAAQSNPRPAAPVAPPAAKPAAPAPERPAPPAAAPPAKPAAPPANHPAGQPEKGGRGDKDKKNEPPAK